MTTYNSLTESEQRAIEAALDVLTNECRALGLRLACDDPAARAAEALARYIVESR